MQEYTGSASLFFWGGAACLRFLWMLDQNTKCPSGGPETSSKLSSVAFSCP